VRKAVSGDEAWSVVGPKAPPPPYRPVPDQLSKWSLVYRWDVSNVMQKMIKEISFQ
jgi:hypothetical protein